MPAAMLGAVRAHFSASKPPLEVSTIIPTFPVRRLRLGWVREPARVAVLESEHTAADPRSICPQGGPGTFSLSRQKKGSLLLGHRGFHGHTRCLIHPKGPGRYPQGICNVHSNLREVLGRLILWGLDPWERQAP